MVGDSAGQLPRELEFSALEQLVEEFRIMEDPAPVPDLVLVLQGVVGVGVCGDDVSELAAFDRLEILFLQLLEQALLSYSSDIIAGIALCVMQQAKVHT